MDQNKHKYWQQQIMLSHESGKKTKEYCRKNKLSYWNFMSWKKKLGNNPEQNSPLVKVTVHPETSNKKPMPSSSLSSLTNSS